MKIKYKFYNQDYEREYVGDNLKRLSKLIIEFLNYLLHKIGRAHV